MKKILLSLVAILSCTAAFAAVNPDEDWGGFNRFREANEAMALTPGTTVDAVFMGNSIIDAWQWLYREFWDAHPTYVSRAISGQVTSQMLVRLRRDVLDLNPKVLFILAGINDIALNNGVMEVKNTAGNIFSMIELARLHGIKVVLCSTLPCDNVSWRPEVKPADKVKELNGYLKEFVDKRNDNGVMYLDLYSVMDNGKGALAPEHSKDGCHPTLDGYNVMAPHIHKAIQEMIAR